MTQYISKRWDGSSWENRYKSDYIFNTDFHLIQRTSYDWDSIAWENQSRYDYHPDANGNDTLTMRMSWEGNAWENKHKAANTFDANNNQILRIEEYWTNGFWKKYYKRERIFDSNNNEIQYFFYTWNSNAWKFSSKYDYTYDANNNEIEKLRYYWSGSAWIESDKYTHAFDLSFNEADIWVPARWDYINKVLINNSYDFDNNAWVLEDTIAYYYSAIPIGIVEYNEINVKVYPNPTTGIITVKGDLGKNFNVKVIDITGRLILEKNTNEAYQQIDLNRFPDGIYFIRVSDGKAAGTRKVIKQ